MVLDKNILARRVCTVDNSKEIFITMWRPVPIEFPEGDFKCEFQIIGMGDEKIRFSLGIDEFQAIYISLKQIGLTLHRWKHERGINITWCGGNDENDFGFPLDDYVIE